MEGREVACGTHNNSVSICLFTSSVLNIFICNENNYKYLNILSTEKNLHTIVLPINASMLRLYPEGL